MDWFSWLSKTTLDPTLIYEYGVVFARNELQREDVSYFDHEFLQSMGISIAKHRLQILKLSRKENGGWPEKSGLVSALRKTRKSLKKCLKKLGFHDDEEEEDVVEKKLVRLPELTYYREPRRSGAFSRKTQTEDFEQMRSTATKAERSIAFSGPLDGTGQPRLMPASKSLKLSGPLDGKLIERLLITRSPKSSGPLDGRGLRSPRTSWANGRTLQDWVVGPNKSPRRPCSTMCSQCKKERVELEEDDRYLWASLFRDMKPT